MAAFLLALAFLGQEEFKVENSWHGSVPIHRVTGGLDAYPVISSQSEWERLWERLKGAGEKPPKVDFDKSRLVGVFEAVPGTRRTIRLHQADRTEAGVSLTFVSSKPPPVGPPNSTWNFLLIEVPRSAGKVTLKKRSMDLSAGPKGEWREEVAAEYSPSK